MGYNILTWGMMVEKAHWAISNKNSEKILDNYFDSYKFFINCGSSLYKLVGKFSLLIHFGKTFAEVWN